MSALLAYHGDPALRERTLEAVRLVEMPGPDHLVETQPDHPLGLPWWLVDLQDYVHRHLPRDSRRLDVAWKREALSAIQAGTECGRALVPILQRILREVALPAAGQDRRAAASIEGVIDALPVGGKQLSGALRAHAYDKTPFWADSARLATTAARCAGYLERGIVAAASHAAAAWVGRADPAYVCIRAIVLEELAALEVAS